MSGKAGAPKLEKTALVKALDHVIIASHGPANYAPYCHFQAGGWIVGYDGIIAAGAQAPESLGVAPETELFRHACMRAGSPYSLTAMPDGTVIVRGNKVRAVVPSFPLSSLPNVVPDNPAVPLSDTFRQVFIDAAKLASTKAEHVITSTILVTAHTCVVTDGGTIAEGFHGCNLPRNFLVPREMADALFKAKSMPTHMGWSETTLTVWFGPTLWLRVNLYPAHNYPDTEVIFAQARAECSEYRPVPVDMLQALETLKPFRETTDMHVFDYGFNTREDGTGASYSFEHHILYRGKYPTEGLRMAAAHGQWIASSANVAFWYGPVFRGVTRLGE